MPISTLDIILLIPLAWGAFMGFKKGLILELASLVALILGIYGAVRFSDLTAAYLSNYLEITKQWLALCSLIVTFAIIVFGVFLLAKIIDKMLKIVALGLLNRILGMLFGILKFGLILSVLLYFFQAFNQKFEVVPEKQISESYLFQPIQLMAKPILPFIEEYADIEAEIISPE